MDDDELFLSEEVEFDTVSHRAVTDDNDDDDNDVGGDSDTVAVDEPVVAVAVQAAPVKAAKKKAAPKDLPAIPAFKIVPVVNSNGLLVDGFKFKRSSHELYFLSHFHSDHYVGLTKTFDFGRVYCSPITAALVRLKIGTSAAVVKPLPLNTPHMIEDSGVQVTLYEANHCPGAVIFLFRTPGGKNYLHTGDFRFEPGMLRHFREVRIDALYLDTTFCNAGFTFPPQAEATQYIAQKIQRVIATQGAQRNLFLVGSYTIGKERILEEVVRQMPSEKVFVTEQKLELWRLCGLSDALMQRVTTRPSESRVHVVPMGTLRFDRMAQIFRAFAQSYTHVVAFHPTGWAFSGGRAGKEPSSKAAAAGKSTAELKEERRLNMTRVLVPYSEHSSFTELVEFVRAIAPLEIIPTVDCDTPAKAARQVRLLQQHVSGSASRATLAPFLKRGVTQFDVDRARAPPPPPPMAAVASSSTPAKSKKASSAAPAEPDFSTLVMSASMSNWLSNASVPAPVDDDDDDFLEIVAPDEDAFSESDEEFGELHVDNDNDDNVADVSTSAAKKAAPSSDEDFLLRLYPALVDSPTPSQATTVAAARDLLTEAEKEDPLLSEKLLSEQKWLMQQFEARQARAAKEAKRSSSSSGGKKKAAAKKKARKSE